MNFVGLTSESLSVFGTVSVVAPSLTHPLSQPHNTSSLVFKTWTLCVCCTEPSSTHVLNKSDFWSCCSLFSRVIEVVSDLQPESTSQRLTEEVIFCSVALSSLGPWGRGGEQVSVVLPAPPLHTIIRHFLYVWRPPLPLLITFSKQAADWERSLCKQNND